MWDCNNVLVRLGLCELHEILDQFSGIFRKGGWMVGATQNVGVVLEMEGFLTVLQTMIQGRNV